MSDPANHLAITKAYEILSIAQHRATLQTLEALASAMKVEQLEGKSLRVFHGDAVIAEAEALVCDFADTDPALASRIKMLLDRLSGGEGVL